MSRAPAQVVDAVQLAGRAATIECDFTLDDLPRLAAAGALAGTEASARLRFSLFEGRPAVDVAVAGNVVLTCQRCLKSMRVPVDETMPMVIVPGDKGTLPTGYEPHVAVAERLSLATLVEEQVLLALPLVPMHDETTTCGRRAGGARSTTTMGEVAPVAEDRQRPFANLRELLGNDEQ